MHKLRRQVGKLYLSHGKDRKTSRTNNIYFMERIKRQVGQTIFYFMEKCFKILKTASVVAKTLLKYVHLAFLTNKIFFFQGGAWINQASLVSILFKLFVSLLPMNLYLFAFLVTWTDSFQVTRERCLPFEQLSRLSNHI